MNKELGHLLFKMTIQLFNTEPNLGFIPELEIEFFAMLTVS
jgi:hypothetical protein